MKYAMQFSTIVWLFGSMLSLRAQNTVKDYDGNVYKTVQIGAGLWMAGNLKVTHYSKGEPVPLVKDAKQWDILTEGAYCDLNNNPVYTRAFGLLYNWYAAADKRNVCPTGWHVPSEVDWTSLTLFLEGDNDGGKDSVIVPGKVSSSMLTLNEKMFSVLPEGFRGYDGEFTGIGYGGGGWWSSDEKAAGTAYYHNVNYNTAGRQPMEGAKRFGYHIRCVKD